MKKNLLFLIPMVAVAALLFAFRATGLIPHIIISAVGLVVLVAYALATKKSRKFPPLEILERVFYAVALITGVVIKVQDIAAVAIVHRVSAALFVVLLIVTEIHKAIRSKK